MAWVLNINSSSNQYIKLSDTYLSLTTSYRVKITYKAAANSTFGLFNQGFGSSSHHLRVNNTGQLRFRNNGGDQLITKAAFKDGGEHTVELFVQNQAFGNSTISLDGEVIKTFLQGDTTWRIGIAGEYWSSHLGITGYIKEIEIEDYSDSVRDRVFDFDGSDHSGVEVLDSSPNAINATLINGANSNWEDLGGGAEVYDFYGVISSTLQINASFNKKTNHTVTLQQNTELNSTLNKKINANSALNQQAQLYSDSNKNVNKTGMLQQYAALNVDHNKKINVNALLAQNYQQQALVSKNINVNALLEQNYQQQALVSKNINVSGTLIQNVVMVGYFSDSLTEVHQFNATISITPINTSVFDKKVNNNSQILTTAELAATATKSTQLQSNCYYQTELKGRITKQVNIIGNISQLSELSALFFNTAQPVHLHQFRINGEIVFQRFNGAIVSQRFNGVLS